MSRQERIYDIINELDLCVERFCEKTYGTFFELEYGYKGKVDPQNVNFRYAYVFYNSLLVQFKYTVHAPLGVTNSILECMIHTNKSKDGMVIPLPMLLDYCGVKLSQPTCFMGLLDSCGMREAFEAIATVLEKNLQNIIDAMGDREKIETAFLTEVAMLFNTTLIKAPDYLNEGLYSFLTLRFCSSAFINYMKGDIKTAIKQMRGVKKKIGYEKSVLELWESGELADVSRLSSVQNGIATYNKSGVAGGSKKEFVAMFLAWLALTVVFSPVYLGLFFAIYTIEAANSVYLMGPIYNFPYCILAAFMTAFPASYFVRLKAYKLLFPRSYDKFCAVDDVNNGVGAEKLIKWLFRIIVICSLAGSVLFAKWGINFKDSGFVDNTSFFSLSGRYYSYDEIDHVYYLPSRVNGFGETLDFPSYVMVLKDGTKIDLYEYDEIEEYDPSLIDHLREKGVRIDIKE